MPHEFLVHIVLDVPSSVPADELDALRTRESETAASLAARGYLKRLWRVPSEWANWGLWQAEDEAELEAVLGTLPLRPYMTITVHDTMPHPSDPSARTHLDPAVSARLSRTAEGLVPVVVQQRGSGEVLTLAWVDDEAVSRTIDTGRATYWSRSRREYWVKGDSSGHVQWIKEIRLDCDGDTLLFVVDQVGAACHTGDHTCFDAGLVHRVHG